VELEAHEHPADGQPWSVELHVSKLAAVYLTPVEDSSE
jgi:hypothetical protein